MDPLLGLYAAGQPVLAQHAVEALAEVTPAPAPPGFRSAQGVDSPACWASSQPVHPALPSAAPAGLGMEVVGIQGGIKGGIQGVETLFCGVLMSMIRVDLNVIL